MREKSDLKTRIEFEYDYTNDFAKQLIVDMQDGPKLKALVVALVQMLKENENLTSKDMLEFIKVRMSDYNL